MISPKYVNILTQRKSFRIALDRENHLGLLYDTYPVDTDNIIKPIQDALIGLVYENDSLVTDVESHRRSLSDTFDVALCPLLLLRGIRSGSECVYVRINSAKALESYL